MRKKESQYAWADSGRSCSHDYLMPPVIECLSALDLNKASKKLFDLGCGNGTVAAALSEMGWQVVGVDASMQGIKWANRSFPHLKLRFGSAYDDLSRRYGKFPVTLSLEVVEHLYDPKLYAKNLFKLTAPGGTAILSTPYHGYLKNLAISVLDGWDSHFTALWPGGHIKFWSVRTLSALLKEAGVKVESVRRVGRIPWLAKSMILVCKRPLGE